AAVARALAPRMEDRFASASEMRRALIAPVHSARRREVLIAAALTALLLGALGVALRFRPPRRPPLSPPSPPPAKHEAPRGPAWFAALAPAARPPLPLPDGISPSEEAGIYRDETDGS